MNCNLARLVGFSLVMFAACQGDIDGSGKNEQAPTGGKESTSDDNGAAPGAQEAPLPKGMPGNVTVTGRGLFDCPAVAAPAYEDGSTKGASVSTAYGRYCSGCHGGAGEGRDLYPALPGKLDEAGYFTAVRQGRKDKAMAAFDHALIDDNTVRADFAALKILASNGRKATSGLPAESTWSESQVNDAYSRGMKAWRKADSQGAACASCHSPDAIDLAAIAYPDAAIMRRGALHLSPDDVLAVRDLVHAQRRRFKITSPCSTAWRPFQPGGEVLPGATPAEQDAAFGASLASNGLLLMGEPIADAKAAKAAFMQFAKLDLKKTPIGIAMPHWTRDPFNGKDHESFDDWISAVDHTPNLGAMISADDTYLAMPNDDNYFAMEKASLGSLGNAVGGQYKTWFANASRAKRRSILLGSHYIRMELLGKPGWYQLPAVPYPERSFRYSQFSLLGGMTQEYGCSPEGGGFGGGTCPQLLGNVAASQRAKFGGTTDDKVNETLGSFTHSWWTMANLFDQGMMRSEDNAIDGGMFYWAGRFPQNAVHMPFFYGHVMAVRWLYRSQSDKAAYPVFAKTVPSHPLLLDGREVTDRAFVGLPGHPVKEDSVAFESSVIFRSNLLRTLLLQQKELLDAGTGVIEPASIVGLYETGLPNAGWYVGRLVEMWNEPGFEQRHPGLAGKKNLLATGLATLMQEVVAKIKKAPVVVGDEPGRY